MALAIAAVALVVALIGAARWVTRVNRKVWPPTFPCLLTAKTGWLTAVSGDALLRLEFGEGQGRVGVAVRDGIPAWTDRSEAEVRALVVKTVEPIASPIRSKTGDRVALYAVCDGVGSYWSGDSTIGPPSFRECVHPRSGEGRFACLLRIREERQAPFDEAAGAVSDRIREVVTAGGVALSPPALPNATRPPTWVPRGPGHGILKDVLNVGDEDEEDTLE